MGIGFLLNNGTPAVVLDLEKLAQTNHKAGNGTEQRLSDGHVNYASHPIDPVLTFGHVRSAEIFSIDVLTKVVGPYPFICLERKVNIPRGREYVSLLVILNQQVVIGSSVVVE